METMEETKHQGFTNYETFAVGVWIDNEQELLAEVTQMVQDAAARDEWGDGTAAGVFKEWLYAQMPEIDIQGEGPWGSLLRAGFDSVDFLDLARHYLSEEEV